VSSARPAAAAAGLLVTLALAAGAWASHDSIDLVSTGPAGGNGAATAAYAGTSEDGGRVYFQTIESLVAADTDSRTDVYERSGTTTTLISTGPTGGNGTFNAFFAGVSADGARVFFGTSERLVAGDNDSQSDVYERAGGSTTLLSTGPGGGNGAQSAFFDGASDDGARVFFHTNEKLVAGDTDSQADVYQRAAGTTTLLSTGPAGGNGLFPALFDGSSADGTHVYFDTDETLAPGDSDTSQDVYERFGATTTLMSTGPGGGNGAAPAYFDAVSRDGARVLLSTDEALVGTDTDAQFDVYERSSSTTTLVSTGPSGGNGASDALFTGISNDGGKVFFQTDEQLVSGDSDAQVDVYERSAGTTVLVSTGGNGAFDATFAGTSADGGHVFFETEEALTAGDTDAQVDVYERAGGTTTLVSTGPAGGNGPFDATFAGTSADGLHAFMSTGEPLVAADSDASLDVYEREPGATTLLSTGPAGGNGAFDAQYAGQSVDGGAVFLSTSEQLASPDADSSADIYAARASAGYARPKGATPMYASLVPAYEQCTAPDRTHGPPLVFGSCSAPAQTSDQLTVGTFDANGYPAGSVGFVRLSVQPGDPATAGDQADVGVTLSITDVRRSADGSDYTGEIEAYSNAVRMTDRGSGSSGSEPATVSDFAFSGMTAPCTATAGTIGATCSVSTSFDAITPGSIVEGRRAVWQLSDLLVADGGPDGDTATPGNSVFARQGIFVP
jgi:hypothetical protein